MKTYRRKVLVATMLLCTTLCVQSNIAQNESKPIPSAAPMQQESETKTPAAGQGDGNLPNIDFISYAEEKNTFEEDFKNIFENAIGENPSISHLTLTVDFRILRESKGRRSSYIPSYEGMSVVKSLDEPDEEMETEFESESEQGTSSNGASIWTLIVVFIVGGAVGYFFHGNKRTAQYRHDSSKKKTSSYAGPHKYEQMQAKSENSVMTQQSLQRTEPSRDNRRDKRQDFDIKLQLKPQDDTYASQSIMEESVIANEESTKEEKQQQNSDISPAQMPYEPLMPKKIVKYGQIAVPGENELFLEEDYIVDDPANMPFEFVFDAKMCEGTYDINESLRSMFAEDPDYIKPYVNPFHDVPGATRIATVSPGKLRKSGTGWKIIEKLTIELK